MKKTKKYGRENNIISYQQHRVAFEKAQNIESISSKVWV
jgi:hypothetical protein